MTDNYIDVAGGSKEVVDKLIALGTLSTPIREHPQDGTKIIIVPEGFKHELLVDPDKVPVVTKRAPRFLHTDSFVAYVNAFKIENQTRIFLHPEGMQAVAVIDYDKPSTPDRGVHRAALKLELSPEWLAWSNAAAQTKARGFTQEDFAEFLEEHGVDVVTPTAAEVIELVTKMQITRQVNYKRAINLQDGRQQFTFVNDNESGTTEFPAKLELGIPVFKGGERYKVTILLRYRLQDGGSLRFAMIVHRQEEILHDALQGDIKVIEEKTGVPVHIGMVA